MKRETVDRLLGEYRVNVARVKHLEVQIRELTELAQDYRAHAAENLMRITPSYGDTPGGGGAMSSKVERLAIMLADGESPGELKQIEAELSAAQTELRARQASAEFVEAWLKGLQERERLVVTAHILDGLVWSEVIDLFNATYGIIYSRTGLKQLLFRAMDKIYRIAC